MKKGDLVTVHDWSYTLDSKSLKEPDNSGYLDSFRAIYHLNYLGPKFSRLFKIIKFGKFPSDDSMYRMGLIQNSIGKNELEIENIETKQTFFIKKRFVRIPILFRKY